MGNDVNLSIERNAEIGKQLEDIHEMGWYTTRVMTELYESFKDVASKDLDELYSDLRRYRFFLDGNQAALRKRFIYSYDNSEKGKNFEKFIGIYTMSAYKD